MGFYRTALQVIKASCEEKLLTRICYVFTGYPAPTEVFGEVEMQSLLDKGVDLSIVSIRSQNRGRLNSVDNCLLRKVKYSEASWDFSLFVMFIINPRLFFESVLFMGRVSKSFGEFLRLLLVSGRCYEISKYIKGEGFDLVHLFWGHYPSLINFFLKRGHFDGKISTFVGAYDLTGGAGIMKWGVNNSDFVFTHAKANIDDIKIFYQGALNVLYRGVNCVSYSYEKSRIQNEPVFAFSGRLITGKRPLMALELFSHVKTSYPSAKLHIFGDGPMLKEVLKKIHDLKLADNVVLHGHVTQKAMFEIFKEVDFFLFPSVHTSERLPNVVKESMLLGCVPVVSYSPGIDELVVHGVNGVIDEFYDLPALAADIIHLVVNSEKYEGFSSAAREKVLKCFNNDELAEDRLKIWFG